MSSFATLICLMSISVLIKYSISTMIRQYHFDMTPRTWNESKTFCKKYYNGLATILTADDFNSAVFTIPIIVGSGAINRVWIGLNDIDYEGVWSWDDNTTCSYNPQTGGHDCSDFWYNAEPNDWVPAGGEDCGALWDFDGHWFMNDESCDNTFSVLCNKQPEYRYRWNGTWMNWTDAKDYCNTKHAGLATIQTSDDYMNAIKVIPPGIDRAWIGLTDMNNEGVWKWSNGDKCIQDNNISHDCSVFWLQGQPDDWNSNEDCAELWYPHQENDWIFNDLDCSYTSTVLCIESDTRHPTPQPPQDIYGGHFVFSPVQRTWAEAMVYCRENYYGLASILDQNDINIAKQLIPNNADHVLNTRFVWIGLNDLKNKNWEWSDGTQCTVNNNNCTDLWTEGEPNTDDQRAEDCAVLEYFWKINEWEINDVTCDYVYAVLCSHNETTANPTIKPSKSISSTFIPTSKPKVQLPTWSPTRAPISSSTNGKSSDSTLSSTSSISTLDIVLILIIIVLLLALGSTIFCFIRFKKMYKRVEEMSNYVGQTDTTKDTQLMDDEQIQTTIN